MGVGFVFLGFFCLFSSFNDQHFFLICGKPQILSPQDEFDFFFSFGIIYLY